MVPIVPFKFRCPLFWVGKNRFLKMIDRLQEIKDGKITKEEQDKKIGREYADEFVQPLVNKLDSKKS